MKSLVTNSARVLCLLAVLVGSTSSAFAAPIVVGSGWQTFDWFDGLGPIDSPADGYQFTALGPVEIRVVDCCRIGDQFDVFVNGGAGFTTSAIQAGTDGIGSGAFTGDAAWADTRLSKGSLVLGSGIYDIDISVIRLASGSSIGAGFFRVDAAPVAQPVPEPGSFLLFGAAAAGLGARARSRRRCG